MQFFELYMDARMFPGPLKSPGLDYGGDYSALFSGIIDSFRTPEEDMPEKASGGPLRKPDGESPGNEAGPEGPTLSAGDSAPPEIGDLYMMKLYSRRLADLVMKLSIRPEGISAGGIPERSSENPASVTPGETHPESGQFSHGGPVAPENTDSAVPEPPGAGREDPEAETGDSEKDTAPEAESSPEKNAGEPAMPAAGNGETSHDGTGTESGKEMLSETAPAGSDAAMISDSETTGISESFLTDSPAFAEVSGYLTGILEMERRDLGGETVFCGSFRNDAGAAVLIFDRKTSALSGIAQVYPRLAKVLRWPLDISVSSASVVCALYAEKQGISVFSEMADFAASRNRAVEETLFGKAVLADLPPLSSEKAVRNGYLGRFITVPEITPGDRRAFRKLSERASGRAPGKNSGTSESRGREGGREGKGGIVPVFLVLGVILILILIALVHAGIIELPAL